MTKKAVIWGIVLIVAGLILGTVALFAVDFDFATMKKLVTKTHTVEDSFQNIHIDTKLSVVRLVVSDNDTCRVDCRQTEKYTFRVFVAEGTLTIESNDSRAWYDHIGINSTTPGVTVYLPKKEYQKLKIENTTGDVSVGEDFTFQEAAVDVTTGDIHWDGSTANSMALKSTTGDIVLTNVTTEVLALKATTGDISLINTTAHALSASSTTGDIKFDRFDARSMNIKATTGSVTGTLLTPKQFTTHTTTGDVQVPHSTDTADACKITVTTGDILISLAK